MGFMDRVKGFFDLDGEEENYYAGKEQSKEPASHEQKNVVSIHSVQQDSRMVLCEPREFDEVEEIADHIKKKKSVVINMQRLDQANSKRMVDFLSGTVYGLGGTIQKLGSQTFLCTPEHVSISGSITGLIEEEFEFQRKGR
ncbi:MULTISPECIES: cell division protein SepF [Allobacillus]|uniref:Cell division protein SepF n=1 Tax=Allobacillus halotolerans TaxID=570278 RepID=A0ABS6GSA0_9BACI|nr:MULTISPECIES: cell division protein SepF [Allobacillus]MBU6081368.1 cell division protein SepF [Allobacillus halotolerans]TSJ69496.1 cell division protein SepF [Allobacillus sp. SKP2-8]